MGNASGAFPPGSVGHSLLMMRGVWHDHIELYHLSGAPLPHDQWSGAPGASPFDNLVYIDFDGVRYTQTNVTFRGRPLHVRSFRGELREGVLHFDLLGPQDPGHIGVSGGVGILMFCASRVTDAMSRYAEPDFLQIMPTGMRLRTTILYRDGIAVRTLTAHGMRIAPLADRRVAFDPRGAEGEVHPTPGETHVFAKKDDTP
ncbi:MAG: hypothetical protein HS103_12465 [Anaerolineales bacterium]|nr:hypothetical protein [Anaerolineales bacterium]